VKLDPNITPTEISAQLRAQAERVYGHERAEELADQIEHLSNMLSEIARRELGLTDTPPDRSGIPDRGQPWP
jgi:hypothetical protein